MKDKQIEVFESDNIWKSIFSMVGPALIAILVMLVYNLADMIFVGQTGETAQVAAISVVSPIFNMIMAVAMLISGGGSVIIARDLGSKDIEHAKMSASLCMWGAVICGMISGAIIIAAHNPLLVFLGATEDIAEYAKDYMIILALGAPFLLITNMLAQLLRAEGAVKEGLIGNLLGTIINIILDPIFILGFHMGVIGAAVATVLGNMIATIYFAYYLKKKAIVVNMSPFYAKKNPIYIFPIMSLGLPNAISTLLSGLANSFANQLLGKYGSDSIAANAAAGRVNMIIVMVLMGICMGAQPLISYNYGADKIKKLAGVMKRLIILTVGVGVVTTVFVILYRGSIIGLFLKAEEVAKMAEDILTILMISSPFLGFFFLATNFLQATGKVVQATIISAMQKGLVLIPALYILEKLLGFLGIRLAYVTADFISIITGSILLILAWRSISLTHEKSKKTYIQNEEESVVVS
ncbi:MAG: MATE family efflux transporter [Lachnospiraceae bacterium]|nr:MATE family efflux transporter [Lachnospiraceae bacterium]